MRGVHNERITALEKTQHVITSCQHPYSSYVLYCIGQRPVNIRRVWVEDQVYILNVKCPLIGHKCPH